jgi:hypothetical protein
VLADRVADLAALRQTERRHLERGVPGRMHAPDWSLTTAESDAWGKTPGS